MNGATNRSLVIVEELGRGTTTGDGLELEWSILQLVISDFGCPALFATHFHELSEIQNPTGVRNTHVHAEVDKVNGRLPLSVKVAGHRHI